MAEFVRPRRADLRPSIITFDLRAHRSARPLRLVTAAKGQCWRAPICATIERGGGTTPSRVAEPRVPVLEEVDAVLAHGLACQVQHVRQRDPANLVRNADMLREVVQRHHPLLRKRACGCFLRAPLGVSSYSPAHVALPLVARIYDIKS